MEKKAADKKAAPAVEKNRYSPEELQEFKTLILEKIAKAEKDLEMLQQAVAGSENDVSDTAPTFKTLEEGSNVLLKEENQKLAARQQKFIRAVKKSVELRQSASAYKWSADCGRYRREYRSRRFFLSASP